MSGLADKIVHDYENIDSEFVFYFVGKLIPLMYDKFKILLVDSDSTNNEDEIFDEKKFGYITERLLNEYRKAFEELAK